MLLGNTATGGASCASALVEVRIATVLRACRSANGGGWASRLLPAHRL